MHTEPRSNFVCFVELLLLLLLWLVKTFSRLRYSTSIYGYHSCLWPGEKTNFQCPRSRAGLWSREAGSNVPSRISPFMLHIRHEPGVLVLYPVLPVIVSYGHTYLYPSNRSRDDSYEYHNFRRRGSSGKNFPRKPNVTGHTKKNETIFQEIIMQKACYENKQKRKWTKKPCR